MRHAKHGLGALGVCLVAALGLAGLGAASASAATEAWLIEGKAITEHTNIHAILRRLEPKKEGEETQKHLVLLIPSKELNILCEILTTDDGLLFPNTVEGLITLLITECKTEIKGKENKGCKPFEPIVVETSFHLILHPTKEGSNYLLFEPDPQGKHPKTFTTLQFNEETCALPNAEITGSFVVEGLGENYELKEKTGIDYIATELVHHLITQAPAALFPEDVLKYGANEMRLDGVADVLLSGPNEGKKWSGHV